MVNFISKFKNLSVKIGAGKAVKFDNFRFSTEDVNKVVALKASSGYGRDFWMDKSDAGTVLVAMAEEKRIKAEKEEKARETVAELQKAVGE